MEGPDCSFRPDPLTDMAAIGVAAMVAYGSERQKQSQQRASIDTSFQVSYIWSNSFRREKFLKSANQKQESPETARPNVP
jgi:hypothetical protein